MKKPILLFIAFTVFFLSCRKFEDGGKVRHCKSNMERGWMLESYIVNNNDSTLAKMNVGFDSTIISFFGPLYGNDNHLENGRIGQSPQTFYDNYYGGKMWDIDKGKKILIVHNIFFSWRGLRSQDDYPDSELYFLGPKNLSRTKISKLTEDQLWLDDNLNGNHYVIHFKAYKK